MASLHVASELVKAITNIIYPVGSIYLSINTTNPSSYLGGTWEQVAKECYLLGYNGSNTWFDKPGQNKGSKNGPGNWNTNNHTLTINEIPSHNHFTWSNTDGFATHCVNTAWGNYVVIPKSSSGEVYNYQKPVSQGGGKGHNHFHVSPYYTVVVWRRTA